MYISSLLVLGTVSKQDVLIIDMHLYMYIVTCTVYYSMCPFTAGRYPRSTLSRNRLSTTERLSEGFSVQT